VSEHAYSAVGPAIRKLFDWLIIGQTLSVNPAHAVRGPTHFVRHGNTPVLTEEQTLGVVQPPLAASLYSASLTCVPQAVP
jgi:site-specific recombinase XerC